MDNQKVRFGVLGCGAAGLLHAAALKRCPITELVMVADINPELARTVGSKFQVPYTCDADALLGNKEIEAVSIALPHYLHYEYSMKCAEAGKHLIVEKPFTLSQDHARRVINVYQQKGLCLSVWLERRYYPFVKPAQAFLKEGNIGKIISVAIDIMGYKPRAYWEYGMRFESSPSNWRQKWETSGGGPLLMNGIHQIDLVRCITGLEVVEVTAQMATFYHTVDVEDTLTAILKFDNGALGQINCSCAAFGAGSFPMDIRKDIIYGTDGYIQLGAPMETYDRIWYHRKHEMSKFAVTDAKIEAITDFSHCLREGISTAFLAEEIIKSQAVIQAAYASARTGKTVSL